jgi:hypothetical protein
MEVPLPGVALGLAREGRAKEDLEVDQMVVALTAVD